MRFIIRKEGTRWVLLHRKRWNREILVEGPREGPHGFPTMFPELPKEDQRSALVYVSHADETERLARIKRVPLTIEEKKLEEDKAMSKLSNNLLKGKGMVFGYSKEGARLTNISSPAISLGRTTPEVRPFMSQEDGTSDQSFSSPFITKSSTVFSLSASRKSLVTGTAGGVKKTRNRPPAWKRRQRKVLDKVQRQWCVRY
ncbi:hypothetical protein F2Q68_00045168 [Brassica cretica]|uniref:Uncharacterized protein n=1 Tax=Brassica cretica TaxID=69181 RepID=A0A8S9LSD0_BRACR|nr:hypothetical protein F2Q68_00045168 [Brassica cretica]